MFYAKIPIVISRTNLEGVLNRGCWKAESTASVKRVKGDKIVVNTMQEGESKYDG
jgi:hypothetical protein